MRRIKTFHTADPASLASELHRFEDTVANAIDLVPVYFMPRLAWSDWVAVEPVQATYGVIARIDTTGGDIKVVLPSVSPETASRIVGVVRRGPNDVYLYPPDGALIDSGASYSIVTTNGLHLYIHDGTEWFRL